MKKNKIFGSHHAYGGSTCHRWTTCTASVPAIIQDVLDKKITLDSTNKYAALGTAVHWLIEKCLTRNVNPNVFLHKKLTFDGFIFYVNEEMINSTQITINFVKKLMLKDIRSTLYCEQKFDFRKLTGADSGGSADIIIISKDTATIHVYDYKNGRGIVEIHENAQCKFYAIGAYLNLNKKDREAIKFVKIGIIQPNVYHEDGIFRTQKIKIKKLLKWFDDTVITAIKTAESGKGVFYSSIDNCRYCERAGYCVENNKRTLEVLKGDKATNDFKRPSDLTKDEIKNLLENKERIEKYLKSVYSYAAHAVDKGEKITGYRLVKSISNRKFKDLEKLALFLNKRKVIKFHKPLEIKTPAQLELHLVQTMGWEKKKAKLFVDRHTERHALENKLVRDESGGEQAINSLQDDFKNLKT